MQKINLFGVVLSAIFISSCGNSSKIFSTANDILKSANSGITEDEAGKGIKEALNNGISTGTDFLSKTDGFFKNPSYKILFPPEALKMENALRNHGFGGQCDKVIESLNRGAEIAASEAKPVFIAAINQLTINDAISIVTGGDGAATSYLKTTTTSTLTAKFQPLIKQSLDKVQATKYWSDIMVNYNRLPGVQKINPDLNAFVTEKALQALFSQIEIEENKIRQNPLSRTTELLKKVFNYADLKKAK